MRGISTARPATGWTRPSGTGVVTFQDGLIDMLARHARKGRLVHAEGKLQTRRWKKDGEDSDRFSTEILVVPGHRQRHAGRGGADVRERRGHAVRRRPGPGRRLGRGRDSVLSRRILSSPDSGRCASAGPSLLQPVRSSPGRGVPVYARRHGEGVERESGQVHRERGERPWKRPST